MAAIGTIRNLGPAMEAAFREAGLTAAEDLRALGAEAAYTRLLKAGQRPHFMAFAALALGLQDRPFSALHGADKDALRRRFDAVVAAHRADPGTQIERILDEIGVIAPPGAGRRSRP